MIVFDASAAVAALSAPGPARDLLGSEQIAIPHLADVEIIGVFRRQVLRGTVEPAAAWNAVDTWRRLGLTRFGSAGFMDRIWELRPNLTVYDATYVALAEELRCALVTADARISRAPGIRCITTVVPT